MNACRQIKTRTAFTLAEMLVVLVILTVLTLVAVQSLRPVMEQARFDATRDSLETVRKVIIGMPGTGSPTMSKCFVADFGRLPGEADRPLLLANNYFLTNVSGASPLRDAWGEELNLLLSTDGTALQVSSIDPVTTQVREVQGTPLLLQINAADWLANSVLVNLNCATVAASGEYSMTLQHQGLLAQGSLATPQVVSFVHTAHASHSFAGPLPVGLYTLTVNTPTPIVSHFWLSPGEVKVVSLVVPVPAPPPMDP